VNFPHTATVQRSTKTGTKYTYGDSGSTRCFLQPIDDEAAQLYGITFGKGWFCYLPYDSDVEVADRLLIDGTTYGVKGFRFHKYGNLKHKRASLEQIQ
jgi:hypothetical protein